MSAIKEEKQPQLSIITINRNNRAGLEKTIRSVVNQTFTDFEYIVIDGASTDGSVAVIEQYADQIDYWVSEPDTGIYNAMNKGIRVATGDYLLFLNSGDILYDRDVLKMSNVFLVKSISFLSGNTILEFNGKQTFNPAKEDIGFETFFRKSISHPSTFINRYMFEKYGRYCEENKIVSDWEFFFKALVLGDESYQKLPFIVSVFDKFGISSNPENRLLMYQERVQVLKKFFSVRLLDYLYKADENNQILSQRRHQLLCRLDKYTFLRRFFTLQLILISLFLPEKKDEYQ